MQILLTALLASSHTVRQTSHDKPKVLYKIATLVAQTITDRRSKAAPVRIFQTDGGESRLRWSPCPDAPSVAAPQKLQLSHLCRAVKRQFYLWLRKNKFTVFSCRRGSVARQVLSDFCAQKGLWQIENKTFYCSSQRNGPVGLP